MRNVETRSKNLMMNFYLPCMVSGLLLAGLISITSVVPAGELPSHPVVILAAR